MGFTLLGFLCLALTAAAQPLATVIESDTLKKAAATNTKDDFRYVFEKAFEGLVIDRMEGNEDIFGKLMSDAEFRKLAIEHLLHRVYGALKHSTGEGAP